MSALVSPLDHDTAHTVLSLEDVDELNHRHTAILRRSALIWYVLDDQKPEAPNDDEDRPMHTLIRQALQDLVTDIRTAAVESAAIMARADERRRAHVEKGGA